MSESAKKPAQDLDRQMVFYPAAYTWQRAEAELGQMSLQMSGRRQNDGVQQRKEPAPKRRKQMTFSELTDFVVERGIRAEEFTGTKNEPIFGAAVQLPSHGPRLCVCRVYKYAFSNVM